MVSNEPLLTQELVDVWPYEGREKLRPYVGLLLRDVFYSLRPSVISDLLRAEYGISKERVDEVFSKHSLKETWFLRESAAFAIQKFDLYVLPALKELMEDTGQYEVLEAWIKKKQGQMFMDRLNAGCDYSEAVQAVSDELLGPVWKGQRFGEGSTYFDGKKE